LCHHHHDKDFKSPEGIGCDFEGAIMNALTDNFQDVEIMACWFHLTKNLWSRVTIKDMKKLYNSNQMFRENFKLLKALPFVPLSDI
jgi:hypothetical protein